MSPPWGGDHGASWGPRGTWGILRATVGSKGETMGPWGQAGELTVTRVPKWTGRGGGQVLGNVAGPRGQLGNLGKVRQPGVVLGMRKWFQNGPEDNGSPWGE